MLQPYPKLGLWRVIEPISIYFKHMDVRIYIPASFWTDLASVPNWVWPYLSCEPTNLAGMGLVHDYTSCSDAKIYGADGLPREVSFDDSLIFANEVMVEDGVSGPDRWMIISALKLRRGSYWRRDSITWCPAR
jgi:hypothetical protein